MSGVDRAKEPTAKEVSPRRICNIIQKMAEGHDFYTNCSPRISSVEIKQIEETLGVPLQRDHTFGAMAGPIAVYPLHPEEFRQKAKQFGEKKP